MGGAKACLGAHHCDLRKRLQLEQYHGTTILAVRKDGKVALGGDGQVSIGETIVKANATKVRVLKGGKVLAGFAGSVAAVTFRITW